MNGQQLAAMLRERASVLEESALPVRGPRAPVRPDGPGEADITAMAQRLIAAEYRELATLAEATGD